MNTTRRTLLAIVPVALAGCAVPAGSTLDVARIATDGEAVVAALQAMLMAPAVIVLLGADAAAAAAALATAQAALAGLTAASVAVAVDTAGVQALAASLIKDAQAVIGFVQEALANASSKTTATIQDYLAAAQALLPFVALAAAIALPPPAPSAGRAMTETRARIAAHGG